MELYLKITAGLLLFVQAVHLASLQDTTDSPGRTIDKSWLRDLPKNTAGSQNAAINEEDATNLDSSSGTSSGLMATPIEEQNVTGHEPNNTSNDLTVISSTLVSNGTTMQSDFPGTIVSSTSTTLVPTNSSQLNITKAEESTTPPTSTTPLIAKNSTIFPHFSNRTLFQSTTFAPQSNATQEPTTKSEEDRALTNSTGSNSTTTVTKTTTPEINKTSTTFSSMTVFPSETTETSTVTMTTTDMNTPVKANKTDKDAAPGSSSERGLAPDPSRNKKYVAWAIILGTAMAVTVVGLAAYIYLKRKRDKGFSHRKLVEEYPSDPVLRLDTNEPLDLNFGGWAHYNPGLQGDNIQMTNFPERR